MRALTIRQPHAWAVARGLKPVENRPASWLYRGPVLIHSGQQNGSTYAWDEVERLAGDAGVEVPMFGAPNAPTECAYGAVIAVGQMVASHRAAECYGPHDGRCSPWAHAGRAHHRLAEVRVLRYPVPAAGNTILWTPTDDLVEEVRRAL